MYNVYYIFSTDENYPRYVGVTTNGIFRRLGEHITKPSSIEFRDWIDSKLSNSICISSKVISTVESKEEAETLEKYWIKYFSKRYVLYNKIHNTKYSLYSDRKVVKADRITNKVISIFDNAGIAARSVNGLKCEVVSVCNGKNYLFKGCRWYWEDKYNENDINKYNAPNLSKKIISINKETGIEKEYQSITQASEDLNVSISTVSNWIHNKNKCKEYDWKIISTNITSNQGRITTYLTVLKLDDAGNTIEEIENIKKYCQENQIPLDSIYNALSNKKKYRNFFWKKVALISTKGTVIKTF